MGIQATWTTTYDQCGKTVTVTVTPSDASDGYLDIWGPGFPDDWIQQENDDNPLFFCGVKCTEQWILIHQGKKAARKFANTAWMA